MAVFILVKSTLGTSTIEQVAWFEVRQLDDLSKREDNQPHEVINLYNWNGGYCCLGSNDEILEIVHIDKKRIQAWEELDTIENRKKTTEYQKLAKNSKNKELKLGWLSPSGEMHYCEYQDHISYVHVVLDSDVPTIQKNGWLHIRKHDDGTPFYTSNKRITQDQAYTLRNELGVHVFDEDILY